MPHFSAEQLALFLNFALEMIKNRLRLSFKQFALSHKFLLEAFLR
jgi:hypothetical protein